MIRLKKYQNDIKKIQDQDNPIYFIGRLAEFKYYDMDQVFLRAIKISKNIIDRFE